MDIKCLINTSQVKLIYKLKNSLIRFQILVHIHPVAAAPQTYQQPYQPPVKIESEKKDFICPLILLALIPFIIGALIFKLLLLGKIGTN